MSRADSYPPIGADGHALMDGGGAADRGEVTRGKFRLVASQNGIRPVCYRHRRAYYTAADAARILMIAKGVSLADLKASLYSSQHGRLCP